jgi:hypothetical protein
MLPPKLKNRAVWGKGEGGKDATGFEVVKDSGDSKIFADICRDPENQGWKGSPREFISEDEIAEIDSPYLRD